MMKYKKTIQWLVISIPLWMVACSGLKDIPQKPQVSVSNVSLKSLTAKGGLVNLALNVKNPNGFGIPAERIGYVLSINGLQVANGASTEKINLPANQSKVITLPIAFKFDSVAEVMRNVLTKKKLDFSLSGSVKLPFVSVPFSKSGKLF